MALLHLVVGCAWAPFTTGLRGHPWRVARVYLQTLGATFIKVGQILSTRPDIVPRALVAELRLLQDQVPPFGFRKVHRTLRLAFGRELAEVFQRLEERPVASASVAQVHRGWLLDGREVAVKVRRPEVVRQADLDEVIMVFAARLVSWIPTLEVLAPVETAQEFCGAVRDQLDFRKEAANNRRFRENFRDDKDIRFPELVDELCTDAVLVMEYVEGVKDDDIGDLDLDRQRLARIGADAILDMVYRDGFVHADLHPGNILFRADHRVYFIDLGMVGEIDPHRRLGLAATILALARNDGLTFARFLYEGSPRKAVRDYPRYEADVCRLVAGIHGRPLHELELSVMIAAVFDILRRHRIRADASFTMINIAMLVVEGLGKKLDPDMNMFEYVQPHLAQIIARAPALYQQVVTASTPPP